MPDPKPTLDTAEELYGALDNYPDDECIDVGVDVFRVRDLRELALFAKQALDAI